MAQGKAFNKDRILEGLRPLFELGYSRYKACKYGGFDESLLAKWEKAHPELSVKINAWIADPSVSARRNIVKGIKRGNKTDSKWWSERIEKDDFNTRTEVSGPDGQPFTINMIQYSGDGDDHTSQLSTEDIPVTDPGGN